MTFPETVYEEMPPRLGRRARRGRRRGHTVAGEPGRRRRRGRVTRTPALRAGAPRRRAVADRVAALADDPRHAVRAGGRAGRRALLVGGRDPVRRVPHRVARPAAEPRRSSSASTPRSSTVSPSWTVRLDEVFAPVRTVVTADADAFARLTDAGLAPRHWVKLGPTSALQSLDDDALRYDPSRWQVDVDPATASCCSPTSPTASPPATASGPASTASSSSPAGSPFLDPRLLGFATQ